MLRQQPLDPGQFPLVELEHSVLCRVLFLLQLADVGCTLYDVLVLVHPIHDIMRSFRVCRRGCAHMQPKDLGQVLHREEVLDVAHHVLHILRQAGHEVVEVLSTSVDLAHAGD